MIPKTAAPRKIMVTHPGGFAVPYYMVALMQELGHDVEFETGFYFKQPGFLADLVRRLPGNLRGRFEKELRRRFHAGIDPRRVRLHPFLELAYVASRRLGLPEGLSFKLIRLRNEVFDRRVARRLRRPRPDLVVAHDSCALHTFRSAKRLGVVSVLNQVIGHIAIGRETLREEAELCPEFADTLTRRGLDHVVERCRLEALEADHILAPSEYVRDTLVAVGVEPKRIALLPYGVDVERFRPSRKKGDAVFQILFVGQIGQRKGIKYLLEAVKRLSLRDAELVLVGGIVGSGQGLAPYRDLFRHIPNVPYHQVHSVYRGADIFVYPSLHEGSTLAIYEALASGLPVITTANAGSVVRDGEEGYIVPIRDVEALMDRILRLYRDRELLDSMGRKARARAECHTWEHYGRSLDRLVQRFMAETGACSS
ncbi:MAG: glycosyltransferase family 4 protein [Proteobacteria bacterium]|nr:glycosyltransferase family 4 protein [Pseudomonadota bacterium]